MTSREYFESRNLTVSEGQPNLTSGFEKFLSHESKGLDHAENYHAHIYFGAGDLDAIEQLHSRLGAMFPEARLELARTPRGPHSQSYLEIQFGSVSLAELCPLLVLCARRWSVLLHPVGDSDLRDHTEHAEWFGAPVGLDFSVFTT